MAALALFVVIVGLCLAAPLYAAHVAHTDPFRSNLDGTTIVDGKRVPVMQQQTGGLGLGVTPIGPTWDPAHYLLGADDQGRDVAARLLYGGRNSLLIGAVGRPHLPAPSPRSSASSPASSAAPSTRVLSRLLDVVWAFPVYLLAICLSTVLLNSGFTLGPFTIDVRQPAAADPDHRHRLRALCGAADPRRGALAARSASSWRPRSASAPPTWRLLLARDPAQRRHDA